MNFILVQYLFFIPAILTFNLPKNYECGKYRFCITFFDSILFQDFLKYTYFKYIERVEFEIYYFRLQKFKKNKYSGKLQLNFLSELTELVDIYSGDLDYLVDVCKLANLKSYHLRANNLSELKDNKLFPMSIEKFDFSDNKINFVSKNFFLKFKRLQEVNLFNNQISKIERLDFDSNYLKYLNFKNINANSIEEIYFVNNITSHDFTINFEDNNLDTFPKIQGNLKRVHKYIIGLQSKRNLLYDKALKPSDNLITIVNLVIDHRHFIRDKISDSFSCLFNNETFLYIELSGELSGMEVVKLFFLPNSYKLENLYKIHITKSSFDIDKCERYVIVTTITTTIKTNSTFTRTITKYLKTDKYSTSNTNYLGKKIEKIFQNTSNISNTASHDYKIGISNYFKAEKSIKNRFLNFIIENPGKVVIFFTSIFLFLLLLFFNFNFIVDKLSKN
ncbi:unnamed protein product [Brachionus calyciflorus]|uniref:Uncharacterized protein n=1 Tax=Brachionus calyciflorus TaxID=104777 RepID=A0A813N3W3_9BILA|nr:unnamed protein product [Brachionus calyciflorus]